MVQVLQVGDNNFIILKDCLNEDSFILNYKVSAKSLVLYLRSLEGGYQYQQHQAMNPSSRLSRAQLMQPRIMC